MDLSIFIKEFFSKNFYLLKQPLFFQPNYGFGFAGGGGLGGLFPLSPPDGFPVVLGALVGRGLLIFKLF